MAVDRATDPVEAGEGWLVEHRLRAVLEVRAGAPVVEVAVRYGASRQSVYNWKARFEREGIAGLRDRSRRPRSSPQRMPADIESLICELRRMHPRWGARRLVFELGNRGVQQIPVQATIHRALVRNGLVETHAQRHKRKYKRWQREAPMHLWQLDLVGGIYLADGRECKMVTGIDDHSRYVVIAVVLAVPNGRAVCEAFVAAMRRYGIPSEVLTDNGKQFTGRFTKPRPAEVLFERTCREHGITARLTRPKSPTTTGKIERWHQTLRRELLDDCGPFADLPAAQAAIDAWVHAYNHLRPHQALGMTVPADAFRPRGTSGLTAEPPRQPTLIQDDPDPAPPPPIATHNTEPDVTNATEAVSYDQRVPPSGSFALVPNGQQIWMGPAWAGRIVTIWADQRSVHITAEGHHVKTVPSRLNPQQLAQMRMRGARPGGPPPAAPALPRVNGRLTVPPRQAIEVDRSVVRDGWVRIANRNYSISPDLVGRRITLRLDGHLMHAVDSGVLVGSWPCPVPTDELANVHGARPAASQLPPTPPPPGSVRVQRRVPADGVTMVARQRLRVGRTHAGKIVTIVVEDTHFRILHNDQELAIHPRRPDQGKIRITAYNRQSL